MWLFIAVNNRNERLVSLSPPVRLLRWQLSISELGVHPFTWDNTEEVQNPFLDFVGTTVEDGRSLLLSTTLCRAASQSQRSASKTMTKLKHIKTSTNLLEIATCVSC